MHLNIWRWFFLFAKLPFIALALLLTEIQTFDWLPHLQWPMQAAVLKRQMMLLRGRAYRGRIQFSYFCC